MRNHIIRAASGQEVCLNSQSDNVLKNTPFGVFKRAAMKELKVSVV